VPATDLDATPSLDAELAAERAHLDASRAALTRMRERAEALFSTGDKVAGDSYTAEQLGRHMARRVKELADARLAHALGDLLGLVLAVDPAACPDTDDKGCC